MFIISGTVKCLCVFVGFISISNRACSLVSRLQEITKKIPEIWEEASNRRFELIT